MSATCLDNPLFRDKRFLDLRSTWQRVIVHLLRDLGEYGDGVLTDDQLRVGICGRPLFAKVTECAIAEGWLARSNGRIARAGCLADDDESDVDSLGSIASLSPGALRNRFARALDRALEDRDRELLARLGGIERALGIAAGNATPAARARRFGNGGAQSGPESRTESQPGSHAEAAYPPDSVRPGPNADPATRLASLASTSDMSEGTSLASPPPPALTTVGEPQSYDIKHHLLQYGFTESQANKVLKSIPIASIVEAIDYLEDGGWPDSKNSVTTLLNHFFHNLSISKRWLAARAQAAAQSAAVMSVDGGGAGPPRRGKTDAEKMADEEAERKAKSEAAARARAHTQPGGVRSPQTWHPAPDEATG